ncbi:MAG: sigma 54-interacting transcriptional regulator [Candidatus Aminicenantales bacterium]
MSVVMVGSSPAMVSVSRALSRAARYDKSVLILGETGTGKDLAARKIHELSSRESSPFVAINCSNLPEGLFESELFGHARGAFTGAVHEKAGLLDVAGNGTVFLDEIGELALHLQAKILRLLDKRESRKVGGTQMKTVAARFVFATNRDLIERVQEGSFRSDLYYRISVIRIRIPALRERREDLPELVKHFAETENRRNNSRKILAQDALDKLLSYDYPGNVRELENVLERSFVFSDHDLIRAEDLRFDLEPGINPTEAMPGLLVRTLEQCHWNKTKAASKLGKSRRQLYRLLEKHNMKACIKKLIF